MRTWSKFLLATPIATLVLAMSVVGASAGRFSISNQSFRITFLPIEIILEAAAAPIRCNFTMEGSFHSRTYTKVLEALVGYVTRASVANESCTGGHVTINQESLPWHLRYNGFTGTLPRIRRHPFHITGMKLEMETEGLHCTTQTTVRSPAGVIAELEELGEVTNMSADEARSIPLRGSFLCEIAGSFRIRGNGTLTLLGTTRRIRFTLI